MVYDIAWWAWHGMCYGMESWHGVLYDLAGMAWYTKRSGEVWMVCGNAYMNFMFYGIALDTSPFTCGEADVSWRSCSQLQDPFTSRGTVTCMFRLHAQLLFTLGSESKLRDCENILYHCSGIEFSTVTVIVC